MPWYFLSAGEPTSEAVDRVFKVGEKSEAIEERGSPRRLSPRRQRGEAPYRDMKE